MDYDGTNYYYVLDLQGDVVAILDGAGTAVAQYTYDAWGRVLATTGSLNYSVGQNNPLRYRGYVYDTETGLYYLQSRYYDPEMGRFINADGYVSASQDVLGSNMFAYCGNNPVNRIDPSGCFYSEIFQGIKEAVKNIVNTIIDTVAYTENDYANDAQMQKNATIVYKYLSNRGWSHNAICATLGNMQQESNIDPGMHQRGGGKAFGIVQWDPASKYTNWATANGYASNSMVGQLEFLIYSMYPENGEWFKNRNHPNYFLQSSSFVCSNESVEYLTAVFLYSYERAGIPELGQRTQYALQWSEFFS